MFVNCPLCLGLVATDPATDLPPERCPRCAAQLREGPAAQPAAPSDARSGVAAAMAEAFGNRDDLGGAADPTEDRAAQPAISIANLLQAAPGPDADAASPVQEESAASQAQAPASAGAPEEDAAPPEPAPEPAPVPVPEPVPAEAAAPTATARPRRATPSFARTRSGIADAAPAGRRWPLPAAIAALSLLLCVQWLVADRARLAADPAWRPVVAAACTVLRCSLPPWREPSAFALLERDVRPHPQASGALRITASFRNEAAWAQPWPEVVLTLSDIDGRPLGTRAFTPTEYLGEEPPAGLLDSGQGAVIRMDVLEPGPGVVGFSFDFR